MRTFGSTAIGTQVAIVLLAVYLLALSWFALTNPIYTWDVVPYVATTFSAESGDAEFVHGATYDLLRRSLDAAQFNALTSGEYAATMYANPDNFAGQLSMYEIKPLYVLALRGMAAAGANPVEGIIWLSLVSGLMICAILFLWLRNLTGPIQAVLVVILFSVGARLFDLSRVPTPDNFSALAIIAGLWLLLARHSTAGAVACFCLSIWIRTNNVIFVAPLFLLLCWNHLRRDEPLRSRKLYWYGGGFALSVLSYFWISTVFDYDWWRLFYHTLIESQVDIGAFNEPFSMALYLDVLRGGAVRLLAGGAIIATVLPLFLLLWLIFWSENWRANLAGIIKPEQPVSLADVSLLCLLVFCAFLFLFPLIDGLDRFLTPYYGLITVFAVSRLSSRTDR